MTKKTFAAVLFAVLGATGTAQAIPVITFQGVANTANVADFYNGGTDSLGYSLGYNYGIRFNATAALNEAGAYVKGPASMSVAANLFGEGVSYYILFNAANNRSIDPTQVRITADGLSDTISVGSNRNPYCNTEADCVANGFSYIHPSDMGGYFLASNGTATTLTFDTDRLDNIQFVVGNSGGSRPPRIRGEARLDRDIPEPASLALFGMGAFGVVAARRRSKRA